MTDRTFDWRQSNDLRNYNFTLEATSTATSRVWSPGHVLDQGQVGACTGFGTAGALDAMPNHRIASDTNHFAMALYELATSRDTYPGDWPTQDTGSSVNGAMRAARDLRLIASYRWLTSADAIRNAILTTGPVVVGSPWYKSMFNPANGLLVVDPSSGLAGGHCWFIYAADLARVTMRNSWGSTWGNGGSIDITLSDLQVLINQGAEACVPSGYLP